MAKVIGMVSASVVTAWQNKEDERLIKRLINIELAKEREREAVKAKEKAKAGKVVKDKAKANYVPFNLQIRNQLRKVMSSSKSFYYINLPKQAM